MTKPSFASILEPSRQGPRLWHCCCQGVAFEGLSRNTPELIPLNSVASAPAPLGITGTSTKTGTGTRTETGAEPRLRLALGALWDHHQRWNQHWDWDRSKTKTETDTESKTENGTGTGTETGTAIGPRLRPTLWKVRQRVLWI